MAKNHFFAIYLKMNDPYKDCSNNSLIRYKKPIFSIVRVNRFFLCQKQIYFLANLISSNNKIFACFRLKHTLGILHAKFDPI